MPTEPFAETPILTRLDASFLRRTAAALAGRAGVYGDLFIEEVRQAEIRRDGFVRGPVVAGGGGGAGARTLSPDGQRHVAVDGLDAGLVGRLPSLVRDGGAFGVKITGGAARTGVPGPEGVPWAKGVPGAEDVSAATRSGPVLPDHDAVEKLASYMDDLAGAISGIPLLAQAGPHAPNRSFRLRGEMRAQRVVIATSEGEVVEDRREWAWFTVRLSIPGRGGRVLEAAAGGGARDAGRLAALRPPDAVAAEIRRSLEEAESAAPAPTGDLLVVLGPGVGGLLFHEACGHGLEGDRAVRGRSAFSNLLGETVGPAMLTLVDDPTLDGLPGSRRVDDEGWPSAPTVLIDAGRVAGLMLDRATALRAGTAPTGHARRESYRDLPLPRMTNTFVREGPHGPEEILGAVPRGLYIAELGRGQVDTASADFAFHVRRGYLVAGGRVVAPAGGCVVTGNGVRALEGVRMIGSDLRFDPGSGECGKEGQRTRAAVGQPTLLIEGLSVHPEER